MPKMNKDVKESINFFNKAIMPTVFLFDPNKPYETAEFWRCAPNSVEVKDDLGYTQKYKVCRIITPKNKEYLYGETPKTSVCMFSENVPPHIEGSDHNIPCSYISLERRKYSGSMYLNAVKTSMDIYDGITKEK